MINDLMEIKKCEVCDNTDLDLVLNLGNHPMCDDLISIDDDRICREYPIEILYCKNCNTAHQKYQIPKAELFPNSYHYRSRFTADVIKGMEGLVGACEEKFGNLSNLKVLDIGCNDGSLLDIFRKKNANTFGIEPTSASNDASEKNHIVYHDYLTQEVATKFVESIGKPDFITFTNVFAHIEDLKSVLASLKILMSDNTILVIENHYLGEVLNKNQFDTFYHEHPRTYSYKSFTFLAQSLERDIIDVEFPSRYGGNIRIFIGNKNTLQVTEKSYSDGYLSEKEKDFYDKFLKMNDNIAKWKANKGNQLKSLYEKHGKINGKAFPGRAAILVKLLGIDENMIGAVYEKPGSLKIDHFIPGTRIPIKSDNELFNSKELSKPILNLAWHISDEIKTYMKNNNFAGEIIDILDKNDFE